MNDQTVLCPKCKSEIRLTEAIAAPILEQARREMASKLDAEKVRIAAEARKSATETVAIDLKQAQDQAMEANRKLVANTAKLAEAQKAQAEAVALRRQIDDEKRELDLTIEKRVSASVDEVRRNARAAVQEEIGTKVSEKQLLIDRMTGQIAEMQKKIEQGSQQAQGEVLELELENELRTKFIFDSIEPVAKGVFGGDVIQRVRNDNGVDCGTIIWEIKRTKNWTEGWLAKLRGDARAAKADIAIIVSTALPEDVKIFAMREGIWISSPAYALALASCLRMALGDVYAARNSSAGAETKMERVYAYLTGTNFKHRISAIVENFGAMLDDLEKERRIAEKSYAKREGQIRIAIKAAAGFYGDIQAIAGSAVGELPALDIKLIEEGKAAAG